jgi:hypothetical protein
MLATRPLALPLTPGFMPRLLLMMALILSAIPGFVPPPVAPAVPKETARLSAAEQASLQKLIRQAEYYPAAVEAVDGSVAIQATNRANDLDLLFAPDGVQFAPAAAEPAWQGMIGLHGYGYAGATQSIAGVPALSSSNDQVTYRWPTISEWYVNGPAGLKQNLTLAVPPAGTARRWLQFDLAIGGLQPLVAPDKATVTLHDARGNEALHLGALYVYDASGRTLNAHYGEPVVRDGKTLLPLLVDGANARYPITVDPLLSTRAARLTAATPVADAGFGSAVAISNDLMLVGAPGEANGAAYLFARNQGGANSWALVRTIVPTTPVAGSAFGTSVDIDGDTLVVGAPNETTSQGAAYIFSRNQGGADTWGQVQRIVGSTSVADDRFGNSVTISGDTVAVGAPQATTGAGAVFVFARNQGGADTWGQVVALPGAAGSAFGTAVSLFNDTLIIGAPGRSTAPNTGNGAAFVHSRNTGGANAWGQVKELLATDRANSDVFGAAVAISGDTIVIGAPNKADGGAAYIFARNQGGIDNWGQVRKLIAPNAASGNFFGSAVAISGDTALVSAPIANSLTGLTAVYLRNQDGADQWGLNHVLEVDDAPAGVLGRSVAIDGLFIGLGASNATVSGQTAAGAAYTFVRSGNTWAQLVQRGDGEAGDVDNFGYAVALSGDTLAVGASGDDEGATTNRGAVYLFRRNQTGADTWTVLKKLVHPTPAGGDDYGFSVDLEGDTLVVGARRDDIPGVTDAGSAFIYRRNTGGADNWGLAKTLNAPTPAANDFFGYAVAVDGDVVAVSATQRDVTTPAALANVGRVFIFARNTGGADNWGQVAEVGASGADQEAEARFGTALDLDGDTLVVGNSGDNDGGTTDAGAAYIFARNQGGADTWGQSARLIAPAGDRQANDYFGASVTIDGDTVAIGALGDITTGSVYLFQRNQGGANAWQQTRKINGTSPSGATIDDFGSDVALDNDTLVVGSRLATLTAPARTGAGAVYVFYRNQGGADTWGQAAELLANDGIALDQFGFSVATAAGLVVVGAPFDTTYPGAPPSTGALTDNAGAGREVVYLFNLNDTVVPTVTNVTSSTPDGTYNFGDTISIQVTFSEPVFVVGAPTLTLETGAVDRTAAYASGSGTNTLTFNYTVQGGDTSGDLDYISTAALALAGGLIRDLSGNNATLTLPAPGAAGSLGANKALVIDGVLPTVINVSSTTAAGTYGIGDTISIQVQFSEAVNVVGSPTLTLETGGVDTVATYVSGSGDTLNFSYTVVQGDQSNDLEYASTTALSGGTITDGSGNPADLTLPDLGLAGSLAFNEDLVIDGIRPTVLIENVTPDPRTIAVATITITFSEAVSGLGLEELSLTRNSVVVDLSSASLTGGPTEYVLGNLSGLTNQAGAYVLTLNPGDAVDAAGNTLLVAATESWNLTPAATTTVLTSTPNPSVFGQTVTLNATVSSAGGVPSGNVTFFAGGVSLGTAAVDGTGLASITTANLPVGTTALTATYQGNPTAPAFAPSTSAVLNHVVNKANTTMVTDAVPTTAVFGQPVTITSTVTAVAPGAGTSSGSVIFTRGATNLGLTPLVNGVATRTINNLPVGVNNLLGTYNGDTNFVGSSDGASVTVSTGAVTVTLTSEPNPSGVGQDVVFTATVIPLAPSVLTPTGTVEFFNGPTSIGVVAIDANGQALLTISNLPTGDNPITADYNGNGGYAPETSAIYIHTVDARIAVLEIVSSVNPSSFGQTVTFTATISAGIGTPTGSVQFFNGATSLGIVPLNSGQAVINVSNLPIGTNPIRVVYPGDATFDPASDVLNGGQVVNRAGTTTTLTSAPNPSVRGQAVILTASVAVIPPGAGTLTGTVEFFAGGSLSLGVVPLNASGVAVLSVTQLPVGVSSINAVYSGNANYNTSTSAAANQVVNKANTSTTLTTSPNPSLLNEAVTLTVNVVATPPGGGTPTGTVEFRSNGVPIGTVSLNNGVASLVVSNLQLGTSLLTAAYNGDANYNASVSNGINQVVRETRPTRIVLPMIFNTYTNAPALPDLTISAIRTQNGQLQVVITNNGTGSVEEAFWVDVYIEPEIAPTGPNQTWDRVGTRGLVWGVTDLGLPLLPGDSLVLTPGDEFYRADLSNPDGPITPGAVIYAQADSADATQASGGSVFESDELPGGVYNNIAQSSASSTIPLPGPRDGVRLTETAADLPRRR